MAEKVMIIRHGEKPLVPDGLGQIMPFGLLENGEHSEYGLTVRGWQRAGALAILFAPEGAKFRPNSLTTPNTIFASAIGPHGWSQRMQLTIGPLRQKLGPNIAVNTDFRKGDEEQMVAAALRCSGTVLICWAHEALPPIGAKIFGGPEEIPSVWPEHRFDLVWVFDRCQDPPGWTFQQIPQMLLAGDSTEPIPSESLTEGTRSE
jgi:hypothetical protein